MKEYPNVTQKEAATEAAARYKTLSKAAKEKYEKLAALDKERFKNELRAKEEAEAADLPSQRTRNGGRIEVPQENGNNQVNKKLEDEKIEKDIKGWLPAQCVRVSPQVPYDEMKDPNPFYVEETAWRYHNPPAPPPATRGAQQTPPAEPKHFPYVSHEELRPLPPPPPIPAEFPNTKHCRWSFDEDTRVLHADFRNPSGEVVVAVEDEKFLLEMYERDDITVVSEGLVSGLDKEKWTLDYISRVAGDEYYHRFRRFDKQPPKAAVPVAKPKQKASKESKENSDTETEEVSESFVKVEHSEIDRMLSMKVKDFVAYLRRRGVALTKGNDTTTEEEKAELCKFSFLVSWKESVPAMDCRS